MLLNKSNSNLSVKLIFYLYGKYIFSDKTVTGIILNELKNIVKCSIFIQY